MFRKRLLHILSLYLEFRYCCVIINLEFGYVLFIVYFPIRFVVFVYRLVNKVDQLYFSE